MKGAKDLLWRLVVALVLVIVIGAIVLTTKPQKKTCRKPLILENQKHELATQLKPA